MRSAVAVFDTDDTKKASKTKEARRKRHMAKAVFLSEKEQTAKDKHYESRIAYAVFEDDTKKASKTTTAGITYVVQQYTEEEGWEDVTAEDDFGEAKDRLKEYKENQPGYRYRIHREYGASHTAAKKTVKFEKQDGAEEDDTVATIHVMVEGDLVGNLEKEAGSGGQWHYFDHWPGGPFINPGPWDSESEAKKSIKSDIIGD